MNINKSKRLITILTRRWGIKSHLNWSKTFDMIEKDATLSYSSFHTFEFSFKMSDKNVRPLHLNFYKLYVPKSILKELKRIRADIIRQIILNAQNNECNYKIAALDKLCSLTGQESWPIQFGCEVNMDGLPLFKIYVSIINEHFKARKIINNLCAFLKLNWPRIRNTINNQNCDAIGIDLSPQGSCALKIYTFMPPSFFYSNIKIFLRKYKRINDEHLDAYLCWIKEIPLRHVGFLFRISNDSNVNSIKIWARLLKTTRPQDLPTITFKSRKIKTWWDESSKIIKNAKSGVSYLTFECGEMGVYFR